MFNTKKLFVISLGTVDPKTVNEFYKGMDKIESDHSEGDAVLIKFNCPGGNPSLSSDLMHYIGDMQEKLNITTYIETIAASGGYYAISKSTNIISNENALIGSIGVILQKMNIGELAKTLGIEEDNLTVGDYKQPISSFKKTSDEDEEYIKKSLMYPLYNNFLKAVYDNRKLDMTMDDFESTYGSGRVFVASEVEGSLVDKIDNLSNIMNNEFSGYKVINIEKKEKLLGRLFKMNFDLGTLFQSRIT